MCSGSCLNITGCDVQPRLSILSPVFVTTLKRSFNLVQTAQQRSTVFGLTNITVAYDEYKEILHKS